MRNIFISQIISNKPKQPHQQKTKLPQENSKKQYIYEESINLIKNDQKSKQNINPCSKHTYHRRKNILTKKVELSSLPIVHFQCENCKEILNSVKKPYNHSRIYEVLSLFRERNLSESKSYSNLNSKRLNHNKTNSNLLNKCESSGYLNNKNDKKISLKIDNNNNGIIENINIKENGNNIISKYVDNNKNNGNNNIQKFKKYFSNYDQDKNKKIKQNNKNINSSIKKGENDNNFHKKKYKIQTNINNKKQYKNSVFCGYKINNKIRKKIPPKKIITDIFINNSRNNSVNDTSYNNSNLVKGSENSINQSTYHNNTYLNCSENNKNKKTSIICQKKSNSLKSEFNNFAKNKESKINQLNYGNYANYGLFSLKIKEISEEESYKNSVILIQAVYKGYIKRKKFNDLLLFFPIFSKASEIIENVIINNIYNKIMFYLKSIKNNSSIIFKNKTFFYLNKESGEKFNIINIDKKFESVTTQTIDNEVDKEYQKKFNENLRVLNRVMVENCNLKDVYNKNKENEVEINKLFNEIKIKQNIIDIVTNDNQNLAKKLKNMKIEKYSSLKHQRVNNFRIMKNNNENNAKNLISNMCKLFILVTTNSIKKVIKKYFYEMKNTIFFQYVLKVYKKEMQKNKLNTIILKNNNKDKNLLNHYFNKFYCNGITFDKKKNEEKLSTKYKQINCYNLFNILNNKYKTLQKIFFNKINNAKIDSKIKILNEKTHPEMYKLKSIINLIDSRVNKFNELKCKNLFTKWKLTNKILCFKNQIDEKKRKKRQKQRLKKKHENKLVNNAKSLSSNKEKLKEKDVFNFGEHSITTDLSNEMNYDNNKNSIIKATEKLSELLIKAALNYKLISQKKKNNNMRKSKSNSNINDDEYDEDSGDSFGI